MVAVILTVVFFGAMAAGVAFVLARARRARLYRKLNGKLIRIARANRFDLRALSEQPIPSFADRLVVIPNFLPDDALSLLRRQAERLLSPERSFVPAHKKGGTVAYETLISAAPDIVSFYQSPRMMSFISSIVGVGVVPTPIYDQSSLSVLFYERPGDHIGWHFDHNFYRGRHFTVLLALENRGDAEGGLSHAELRARTGGRELAVSSAPNTMIVFEGAAVRHKVTPIKDGERRLILSMTYCTNPEATFWQGLSRRIKDTAFFGMRALWT